MNPHTPPTTAPLSPFAQTPAEIVVQNIFRFVTPATCLKYTRLNRHIHSTLTDPHFALLSLTTHVPRCTGRERHSLFNPTDLDAAWFHWPEHFQRLYADFALQSTVGIYFGNSGLTGRIPPAISRCKSLKHLYLHSNALEGEIPAELGSLTLLIALNLRGCKFSGRLPTEMRNLKDSLCFIYIKSGNGELAGNADVDSRIPVEILNAKNLHVLSLLLNDGFVIDG
ncbi:hypothetical protein BC830DRAFT_1098300 [Chytriomyces sp. MP71]|nr:hypothetical protein BC830DRAFT_1098300 [Chytriomyces sp. MP71]